jgi:glycosyltransferase involved in cell wall biosynthesis
MKIFQVVPYYPPHVGGMEFYVDYLSKRLARKGNEIKVFTSSDKDYSYREEVNGVEIIRLKVSAKFYNTPIVSSLFMVLSKEDKPDIVDTHQYPVYFSDVSTLFSLLRRIPLFLHVHVIPDARSVFSGTVSDLYYRTFEKLTLRGSSYVIAPSLAYKAMLTRMGVDAARIFVVPYGVDLKRFNPAEKGETFKKRFNYGDARIILTVGRLNYQKGFQYLLKAMPIILRHIRDVKLVIVGDGELWSYLRNLSSSLGLSDNVIFAGSLHQSKIPDAYASADVFVLPSLFESLGISLLEAQAMGKPVVATRVGGAPEALAEDKSGILVEPKKPNDLAEAIIKLLRDQNLANSMGQYARKFMENNFDLEKSVDRVFELYERSSELSQKRFLC